VNSLGHILLLTVSSGIAAVGFAIVFNVPRKALPLTAVAGAAGQLAKQLATLAGFPPEAATFLGAVSVGILAETFEHFFRLEVPLFSVPGFIPLVPGVPAFHAIVAFASNQYPLGVQEVVRALLLTAAIGAGLGSVRAVARLKERPLF
jgi:uncharacterized membrane protein YjjB (DUF3815 family)